MASQSGPIERLRGFTSPDVLLHTLLLHVARGYSLRETAVPAELSQVKCAASSHSMFSQRNVRRKGQKLIGTGEQQVCPGLYQRTFALLNTADRQSELLDTEYVHVVFTLPEEIEAIAYQNEEIAAIAYQNKEVVYDILFRATSETLRTITADPIHLGAEIGMPVASRITIPAPWATFFPVEGAEVARPSDRLRDSEFGISNRSSRRWTASDSSFSYAWLPSGSRRSPATTIATTARHEIRRFLRTSHLVGQVSSPGSLSKEQLAPDSRFSTRCRRLSPFWTRKLFYRAHPRGTF